MTSSHRVNPYAGPRAFASVDRGLFYGRDVEISQLVALLVAHQVVLLYAPSGAGRTSLLRAGVIPTLEEQGQFTALPSASVGGELGPDLAVDRIANIFVFNLLASLGEATGSIPEDLKGLSLCEGLNPYLTDRQARTDAQAAEAGDTQSRAWSKPRLLILDWFEEIFISYPERYEERGGFFRQLGDCLREHPELGLLLSMREDYLAQLDSYAAHIPDRLRCRFRLERLDREGALQAVTGPARAAGVDFAPGVAEALVDNLRGIRVQSREPVQALGAHIEPINLQIACYYLWQRLPPDRRTIEMADLEAFGDVDAALSSWYEDKLAQVASATGESERRLRAWIDEQLITPAGTRGLVYRDEEQGETAGLPNVAVDLLDRSFIIRPTVRGTDTWYELAHDRLLTPIQNANRRWLEEHR